MTASTPAVSPPSRRVVRRIVLAALGGVVVVVAVRQWDERLFWWLYAGSGEAARQAADHDWYRLARVAGSLWTWLAIGAAMSLQGLLAGPRTLIGSAVRIMASGALAGLVAELLRPLVGQLRPLEAHPPGTRHYRPLIENLWHTQGLSFPSSHAAVAFGAACMVWWLYRGAGTVALVLAGACALTRLHAGAHFAGDVVAGAVLGALASLAVRHAWPPPAPSSPPPGRSG